MVEHVRAAVPLCALKESSETTSFSSKKDLESKFIFPNNTKKISKARQFARQEQQGGGGASSGALIAHPVNFRFHDPFPARVVRQLVYKSEFLTHTDPGSNQQAGVPWEFNLNSLFLPQLSGGHQPFGFDQMAALYQRYKVLHVSVKVETLSQAAGTAGSTGAQIVGIFPPGNTQTTLNELGAIRMGENFNVSTQIVHPNAAAPVVFRREVDIAAVAGLSKTEFAANVEDYGALVSASPARIVFMEVNAAPNVTTEGTDFFSNVTLVFTAEFWQRVSLEAS